MLTPELAEVFVNEFTREVARLANTRDERDQTIRARLAELEVELENLSRNLLAGVVSSSKPPVGLPITHKSSQA
ncbi:hypothetical protein EAH87_14640 [Sphingomonas koreensis]|nr:hypothetical protein EAH87_14640 [Sphingomonas koreensis]